MRSEALEFAPDQQEFARLNMEFFFEVTAVSGNEPLREISERLYFQTSRMFCACSLYSISARRLLSFAPWKAMEINDLEAVGYIRQAHISMSYTRMVQHSRQAKERTDPP